MLLGEPLRREHRRRVGRLSAATRRRGAAAVQVMSSWPCVSSAACTGMLNLHSLKDASRAHPAADAHRDHAVAGLAPLHLVEQRRRQLGAGAAERMAERDRAAVDVQPRRDRSAAPAGTRAPARRTPRSARRDRSGRASARRASATFRIAGTGPMPKRSGSTPAVANATNRPSGVSPRSLRQRRGRDDDRRGAVAHLRRVAGRDACR